MGIAKKAGSRMVRATKWVGKIAALSWVYDRTLKLSAKAWAWSEPGRVFSQRYVLKPFAAATSASLGWLLGTKLLPVLVAIGGAGILLYSIAWLWNRRPVKVRLDETYVDEVEEDVESAAEAKIRELEEKVFDLEAKQDRRRRAEARKAEAEAEVRVLEAEAERARAEEAAASQEVQETGIETAQVAEEVTANDRRAYKVRLEDGEASQNETLEDRYQFLDSLLMVNQADQDLEFYSELLGRRCMVQTRAGKTKFVNTRATHAEVHRAWVANMKKAAAAEGKPLVLAKTAFNRGVGAEKRRLDGLEKDRKAAAAQKAAAKKAA